MATAPRGSGGDGLPGVAPVTPDWYGVRIGRLTSRGLIITAKNAVCAVMFRCECGRDVKVGISRLHHKTVPFECPKCQKENPNRKRKYAISLRQSYPREWRAWRRLRKRYPKPERWRKFRLFMRDLGPCPTDHCLGRRNRGLPHGKQNTCWMPTEPLARVLLMNGEAITPHYLRRHFGVKRGFTRKLQREGITSATAIIRAWNARRDSPESGDLPHGRSEAVPPRKRGPRRDKRNLEGEAE